MIMKNKNVATIFAIFLWTFWFHKFYLGKWVQWILYILFCATGIPTLLWILEWIVYLSTTKDDFNIKYNYDYITRQKELWYEEKTYVEKVGLSTDEDKKHFIIWLFAIMIWILIYVAMK